MKCPSLETLQRLTLSASDEDCSEVEEHIGECEACRNLLDRIYAVSDSPDLLALKRDSRASEAFAGQKLGAYTVLCRVGNSSSSSVYQAVHGVTDRVVAIKICKYASLSDDAFRIWKREARLAARIQHPNVVDILGADQENDVCFTVFEWLPNGNLWELIQDSQLEFSLAAEFAFQIAKATTQLHSIGVLHRDIKPSNILVDSNTSVKLADFGVAKATDDTAITVTGQIVGTPGFMSPEQLGVIADEVDERADVYGIGAVLYAMLVGKGPFAGSSPMEVIANATRGDFEHPSDVRRTPRDLETICLKCLENKPADRYSSAQAVVDDLGRYLNGQSIQARRPTIIRRAALFAQKHAVASAVVGTLAVCSLIAVITFTKVRTQLNQELCNKAVDELVHASPSELPRRFRGFFEFPLKTREVSLRRQSAENATRRLRLAVAGVGSVAELEANRIADLDQITPLELAALCNVIRGQGIALSARTRNALRNHVASAPKNVLHGTTFLAASGELKHIPSEYAEPFIASLLQMNSGEQEAILKCVSNVAGNLVPALLKLLANEDASFARERLVEIAWKCSGNNALYRAQILSLSSPPQIVDLASQIDPQRIDVVGSYLNSMWRELFDSSENRIVDLESIVAVPPDLLELQRFIEETEGVSIGDCVMLPFVQKSMLTELLEKALAVQLSPISLRPCQVEGEVFVATVLRYSDEKAIAEVDTPESEFDQLAARMKDRDLYPRSVWGRPKYNGDFDELLVTTVWTKGEKSQVFFDRTIEDFGIEFPLDAKSASNADRLWFQELGEMPDEAARQYRAKQLGVLPSKLSMSMKAIRSIALVSQELSSIGSQEKLKRFQAMPQLVMSGIKVGVRERNARFRMRQRKLFVRPCLPALHERFVAALLHLGYQPEDCFVCTSDDRHTPLIASRWSRPHFERDIREYTREAALAFACFQLGNSQPLQSELSTEEDPTCSTLLIDYGRSLRTSEALELQGIFRNAKNQTLQVRCKLMLSNTPGLVNIFEESHSIAVVGSDSVNTSENLQTTNPHEFVEILHAGKPTFIGAEKLFSWDADGTQELVALERDFAISTKEVSYAQYRVFNEAVGELGLNYPLPDHSQSENCAAVEVPYFMALRYCRWLSEKEGIPEDQIGLPKLEDIKPGFVVVDNLVSSRGYRLPTDVEWEIACRAGSATDRFIGNLDTQLSLYGNTSSISPTEVLPVGSFLPNAFGLFDTYGNVMEMCLLQRHGLNDQLADWQPKRHLGEHVAVCGGSFLTDEMYASSGGRMYIVDGTAPDQNIGFRIAKTVLKQQIPPVTRNSMQLSKN